MDVLNLVFYTIAGIILMLFFNSKDKTMKVWIGLKPYPILQSYYYLKKPS